MSDNLTLIVILTSIFHVAAFAVMVWIRVKRQPGEGMTAASGPVRACTVCGTPATTLGYDGLDPDERYDPHTGRAWSADAAHYRPVCPAHDHESEPTQTPAAALSER